MTYPLGAYKDPQDPRDYRLAAPAPVSQLPPVVDYERQMGAVLDQGQRGSCVAHATVKVKEWQERKQRGFKTALAFSREWIYDQIVLPGGGAYPREAMKVLNKVGVPKEQYLPYDPNASDQTPPPFHPTSQEFRSASHYKAQAYARLNTLDEMLASLATHGPFTLAVDWLEGWFQPSVFTGDGYPILKPGDGSIAGGHDIAVVGYDQTQQLVKFIQSWGPDWGHHGFACLSFDAMEANLSDAWATVDVAATVPGGTA